MKKIINGKRYDTKTAEVTAAWENGYMRSDFQYCVEKLYRTPKGNWFLYGEGGAMSKYAQSYGNSTGGGDDITPLSPEEARTWLEEHDCHDEVEASFPDSVEDA